MNLFPDSPPCVFALLILGAVASLALVFNVHNRVAAVTAWLVLALLFIRNPLIGNPSLPFVGWMLLLIAFVRAEDRAMPAWIVTSLAYTHSGWTKLASPSWIDGTAFAHVLANPLARPTSLRLALLAFPTPLLHVMTWSALALELLYAPLTLSRRARPLIWTLMLLMHRLARPDRLRRSERRDDHRAGVHVRSGMAKGACEQRPARR